MPVRHRAPAGKSEVKRFPLLKKYSCKMLYVTVCVCVLGAHCNAAELQNKYKEEVEEGGAVAEGSPLLAGGSARCCEAMNK